MRLIGAKGLLVVAGLLIAADASGTDARSLAYVCNDPSPGDVGDVVALSGTLKETKGNALHVDFDGFGVDFNSVRFDVSAPPKWAGRSIPIYYQGSASPQDSGLPGAWINFEARVPACLDQPWLFWDKIKPSAIPVAEGK